MGIKISKSRQSHILLKNCSYTSSLHNFSYKSVIVYKQKFNIFKDVKFSEDILFLTSIIPGCFVFKTMIVHPSTGDLFILNDDDEPIHSIISKLYIDAQSVLTNYNKNSHMDPGEFKDVIDEIKYIPGSCGEASAKKSFVHTIKSIEEKNPIDRIVKSLDE